MISNKISVHTPVTRFKFAGHGCSYAVMDLQADCLWWSGLYENRLFDDFCEDLNHLFQSCDVTYSYSLSLCIGTALSCKTVKALEKPPILCLVLHSNTWLKGILAKHCREIMLVKLRPYQMHKMPGVRHCHGGALQWCAVPSPVSSPLCFVKEVLQSILYKHLKVREAKVCFLRNRIIHPLRQGYVWLSSVHCAALPRGSSLMSLMWQHTAALFLLLRCVN